MKNDLDSICSLRVLGIMSGTSLDGGDCALCQVGPDVELLKLWSVPFPKPLHRRLHLAASGEATGWETAQLHHDLGRFYATAAQRDPAARRAQLIGLHGQTHFHHPHPTRPATLQIGEPAYLAESLRVPVVSNFRVADLAAGGQGAPLASLFHQVHFCWAGQHVCFHNLGGISNVTSMTLRRGQAPRLRAFDTGPANVLLDLAMRHFTNGRQHCDRDGQFAARGLVCEPLVKRWLKHPYFRKAPPKSTGRELFGEKFLQPALAEMKRLRLSPQDFVATLTEFTARSIALNYRLHLPSPPDRVVVAGGGTANSTLCHAIQRELTALNPRLHFSRSEEYGWPAQAIEPAAFALLAWRRWFGLHGNIPGTTGARRSVVCGQITAH